MKAARHLTRTVETVRGNYFPHKGPVRGEGALVCSARKASNMSMRIFVRSGATVEEVASVVAEVFFFLSYSIQGIINV